MNNEQREFLFYHVIEGKTYDELERELNINRKQFSIWYNNELKEERENYSKVKKILNKKVKNLTREEFESFFFWYSNVEKKCCYCGINEEELNTLYMKINNKRRNKRGKGFEIERKNSQNRDYLDTSNLELACYWCNNAKTDAFTYNEFLPIGKTISETWQKRLKSSKLFISELLKEKTPLFLKEFIQKLDENEIIYEFLPNTKDIWAIDYMPIQIGNKFIQFRYDPDYLKGKDDKESLTDTDAVCKKIGLIREKSDINLDGGNLLRFGKKAIICEKIFKENPNYKHEELLSELKKILHLEQIILLPKQPFDYCGHADAMVRFYDENTIFINDYSAESQLFNQKIKKIIEQSGLNIIEVPYNVYQNSTNEDATGTYINFLLIKNIVFLPVFGLKEDKKAIELFQQYYDKVVPINAEELSKKGGVLNCISWVIE